MGAGHLRGSACDAHLIVAVRRLLGELTVGACYTSRMADRLAGRVCAVTGATGIAAAAARSFAAEGASVFVISLDADECATLAEEVTTAGGACAWVAADLRDEGATTAAFAGCREHYGRLDGLFAVAGASGRRVGDGPLHEMTLQAWEQTFALNGHPAFLATREAVRVMRQQERGPAGRGAVVLISSVLAAHPSPRLFATHGYAAAKGAAIALTRTLAGYYAPDGIRINAVAPGLVATPMAQRAANDPATLVYARTKQPLADGLLPPEDVAAAALYLLSNEARFVTGQLLSVDGGWSVSEGIVPPARDV